MWKNVITPQIQKIQNTTKHTEKVCREDTVIIYKYICIRVCSHLYVCVYMYAYVYFYISVYVFVYVCLYLYMCEYLYMCMCVGIFICMCVCSVYVYVQVYVYVCIYVCMFVYVCVQNQIGIKTFSSPHIKFTLAFPLGPRKLLPDSVSF